MSFGDFAGRRRSRRGGRRTGQKSRFRAAAKACKGRSLRSFRACMRQKLKGR